MKNKIKLIVLCVLTAVAAVSVVRFAPSIFGFFADHTLIRGIIAFFALVFTVSSIEKPPTSLNELKGDPAKVILSNFPTIVKGILALIFFIISAHTLIIGAEQAVIWIQNNWGYLLFAIGLILCVITPIIYNSLTRKPYDVAINREIWDAANRAYVSIAICILPILQGLSQGFLLNMPRSIDKIYCKEGAQYINGIGFVYRYYVQKLGEPVLDFEAIRNCFETELTRVLGTHSATGLSQSTVMTSHGEFPILKVINVSDAPRSGHVAFDIQILDDNTFAIHNNMNSPQRTSGANSNDTRF